MIGCLARCATALRWQFSLTLILLNRGLSQRLVGPNYLGEEVGRLFVSRLSVEEWEEGDDIGQSTYSPTWSEIKGAILAMEPHKKTIVILEAKGDAHMVVGFGGNGRYIVYETCDNVTFHSLIGDGTLNGKELLDIGGQEGYYKRKTVLSRDQALKVAQVYAERGVRDPTEMWESS